MMMTTRVTVVVLMVLLLRLNARVYSKVSFPERHGTVAVLIAMLAVVVQNTILFRVILLVPAVLAATPARIVRRGRGCSLLVSVIVIERGWGPTTGMHGVWSAPVYNLA